MIKSESSCWILKIFKGINSKNHIFRFFLAGINFKLNESVRVIFFEVILEVMSRIALNIPEIYRGV